MSDKPEAITFTTYRFTRDWIAPNGTIFEKDKDEASSIQIAAVFAEAGLPSFEAQLLKNKVIVAVRQMTAVHDVEQLGLINTDEKKLDNPDRVTALQNEPPLVPAG